MGKHHGRSYKNQIYHQRKAQIEHDKRQAKVLEFKPKTDTGKIEVRMKSSAEIYNANMEAIRKHYPEYADIIDKAPEDHDYELQKSKTNLPTLYIKSKNLHYYNPENPIQCVADEFASYNVKYVKMALFLGFGLGYEMLHFSSQLAMNFNCEFGLIVEKDPSLFKLAMRTIDIVPLIQHERIRFMIGEDVDKMFPEFVKYFSATEKYRNARSIRVFYNPAVFNLDEEYYMKVQAIWNDALRYKIMDYGNDVKDSLIGVENMLANLKIIINNPGINMLKNKFKGIPAVCVATGPSLDKNIELLRGLEDKALIIAADASLKPMLNKGLKPHLVCTLEREMAVVDLFKGIKAEQIEDCYLVGAPVIFNEVYQNYPGPTIIVYRQFDHFKWLQIERGMLGIKYSSGNMNFKIAEYLGCDPIILIGQDLALSGNKTNADGAVLGTEQDSYLREDRMMVKGNYNESIETTLSLKMFLDAYNLDMAEFKGTCINATEGGAYINNTRVMTLREAINKYIAFPMSPLAIIKTELAKFESSAKDLETIKGIISRTITELGRMKSVCVNTFEYLNGLSLAEQFSGEQITSITATIQKAKAEITKDNEAWQLFFAHIGQSFFLNFEIELWMFYEIYDTKEKAAIEIISRHKEYFEVLRDLFEICIQDLEKTRESL